GPFVVEGIISGVVAAILSVIISMPMAYSVSPYIASFVPGLDVFGYFTANILRLTSYQILFAVVIGSLSSFIAVKRYLKN
ncbi:MAG: hypothetical protein Q8O66_01120, partial [bacterium]|nr:hypothetical protein [bacterium]